MPEHMIDTLPTGAIEPESLEELRGQGARMVPHWPVTVSPPAAPVSPSRIRGVTVPPASAHLLAQMSDYGD
ncbi:hypothetical protein [Streptomyces cucumeris]|uniref:hypothetical protein n=1 Tax=Streptomyces TaxID=1883 RepID=UPI0020C848EA|nr:hypothetical protein [Streptomyces sp. NEAU-Y11]MCP9208477.1 hypothetical protein [Streptomyces sp. NEAU-Y11]